MTGQTPHDGGKPAGPAPGKGVRFLKPRNILKIRATAPGGLTEEEILARAAAAVAEFTGEYKTVMRADIAALNDQFGKATQSGGEGIARAVPALTRITHDLRGMAGTFGYPLVTDAAKSLHALLVKVPPTTPSFQPLVAEHLRTLTLLADRDVSGPGGVAERQIVDSLRAATLKMEERAAAAAV